ncbi:TPA: hypothetical protein RFB69_000538 [Yersinia enterocolitica]|uniref:hypothetical protein n=1 Tax=Yersinia TaxID=629 RepID=UPI00223F49D7|nr:MULTISPECIES: hypothetical protein [Yersinia]ELI8314412.1 hypothetical protein [Yersinia enterocolitica]ELI8320266.1 hypothetical protein [Yersinia enterocolitica]ELW7351175.1 hypothetical protein [Yersinia enterocolitica]MDA5543332.1 hypothetical protein [Yersinia rochesterensis]UZM73567.1 hypothetical protein OP863_11275 [Yersinia sp. SCPM-O-B-9106 (C-191)]
MKMNAEDTLECLTALLDLLTLCDESTSTETIQNASFLGLVLVARLKEKKTNNP